MKTDTSIKTFEINCDWNQFLIGFSCHKMKLYEPHYYFLCINLGPLTIIMRLP